MKHYVDFKVRLICNNNIIIKINKKYLNFSKYFIINWMIKLS